MSNKCIFRLRRGWKGIDKDGNTEYEDGTPINDWAKYEKDPRHRKPDPGELVVEYDNGIPRLKIGDGVHEFSELPYMSVDSFILPTPTTINLYGGTNNWEPVPGFTDRYTQDITDQLIGKITENSKIDLQPTPEQLSAFHSKDVAFTTVNEDGNVRVCAIGIRPENDYKNIQVTITEVVTNG